MASSSYYYTLMLDYSRSKRGLENKIESYKSYIKKLMNSSQNLTFVHNHLVNTEKTLLDGGYLNQGKTFDNGLLKNNYDKIETIVSDLKYIISKSEIKIQEFEKDIKHFEALYNEAQKNYNIAKSMEENNV